MKQKGISLTLIVILLATLLLPAGALAVETPQGAGGFQETILALPEGYTKPTTPTATPGGGYALAAYHDETSEWSLLNYTGIGGDPTLLPLAFEGRHISGICYAPDGRLMAYDNGLLTGMTASGTTMQSAGNEGKVEDNVADGSGTEKRRVSISDDMEGTIYWFGDTGEEIKSFSVPGGILMQAAALSDGRVVVTGMDFACALFDFDGKELARTQERMLANLSLLASGDTVYLVSSDSIQELGGQSLEKKRSIPVSLGYSPKAAVSADGTLWVADLSGLYTLAPGADTLVLEYEMTGTLISDPEKEIKQMVLLPDGSLVAAFDQSNGSGAGMRIQIGGEASITLAGYVYSDALGQAQETFTITALQDATLLRKAVSEFQRKHPELRVQLNTLLSVDDTSPADDAIRTLNTQLLAGQGGDVLILDRLPMEKYIQKGLLMDLTDALSDIAFLPGIREGSAAADGKLYAMPAQFSFTTLWGPAETVQAIRTMDDLTAVSLASGQTVMHPRSHAEWLRLFFPVCQSAFLDAQGQLSFESPAFEAFLETLYTLYAAQGDYPVEEASINARRMAGATPTEIQSVLNGASLLLPTPVNMLMVVPISYSVSGTKESGFIPLPTAEENVATYAPSLLAGINAQTKRPDLAMEFLRLLYAPEVQAMEQTEGLPTLAEAMDTLVQGMIETSRGDAIAMVSFGSGNPLQLQQPDEDVWNRLRAFCDTLSQPAYTDEVLMQFLVEETEDFFAGAISASDAAQALQQRAWAYLNE